MPYASSPTMSLPFASGSDTSRDGAEAARASAPTQCRVLAAIYERHGELGLTDAEISAITGLRPNIITARRSDLRCVKVGKRKGPFGVTVTAWALPDGRDA
jgi:hypothetical protein